ncbi:MAG: GTP-binding protein, partial [Bacteroidales bacterium]|nr:GTP-binding protein [Bacteroidales bacterium]
IKEKENVKQLVVADTVVISKTENLSVDKLKALLKQIKKHNPLCNLVHANHGDYGNFELIGNSFFNEKIFINLFKELDFVHQKHDEHDHHHEIATIGIQLKGNFDMKKFSYWMDYFLYINQNSIFRVKGILSFEGFLRKVVFQAVKSSYVIEEGNFWQRNEEKISKLIFIGKNLDKKAIKEGLNELIAD